VGRGAPPRNAPRRRHVSDPTSAAARSATLAALLSFIFPGLGQAYAGSWTRAAVLGLPVVTVTAALVTIAFGGLTRMALMLFDQGLATVVLVIAVATGLLRLIAIVDAYALLAPAGDRRRAGPVAVAALVAVSLLAHGGAAWYSASFVAADGQIFVSQVPPPTAGPSQSGGPGDASPDPSASLDPFTGALPTPATKSSRITFLLLGADSGMGYNHALTDSQILVSVDPATKTIAMASIPRDLAEFPMYGGGTYHGKINSLMTAAAANPRAFPDGGIGTLAREVGYLLGVPVNYYAFVNLAGFAQIITAVGGVDVVNPAQISDPGYQFPDGKTGFFMAPGAQHLNSRTGLAFVRTRQGVGDNDYTRARRQQLVLQALRQRLTSPSMLPRLPSLLDALAHTVQTDFPPGRIADMVALAQEMPNSAITQVVLGPPFATNPPLSQTGGVWILQPNLPKIRAWSVATFGSDSAFYVAPAPTPSPS
jgi:polyisoprenyl-teichoic acid--peptidoglycan teichoic acid transferase